MGDALDTIVEVWRRSLEDGDALHSIAMSPGAWWACEYPERPPDSMVCFDFRCRPCYLMAEAAVRHDPTAAITATEWDGTSIGVTTTATYVRIARRFHGVPEQEIVPDDR